MPGGGQCLVAGVCIASLFSRWMHYISAETVGCVRFIIFKRLIECEFSIGL